MSQNSNLINFLQTRRSSCAANTQPIICTKQARASINLLGSLVPTRRNLGAPLGGGFDQGQFSPLDSGYLARFRFVLASCKRIQIGIMKRPQTPLALLLCFASFIAPASPAFAQSPFGNSIPFLGAPDFGWQTNVADWQDPPAGHGHGPIPPHPAHPYVSNAEANRTGGQPTLRIGDSNDPILKPWAAQQILASNEELISGIRQSPFSAQARCFPGGVPAQLLFPFEPLYFHQTEDEVWMVWQRDHWWRRVALRKKHSENVTPSWYGESIGHYEGGNTLVIDTIGLSAEMSFIDNFRTPHSEKLHVVERFTLSEDGNSLTAIVTVEDPDSFNAPLTMQQRWFKQPRSMTETICAENNRDFPSQVVFPMPQDDTPDF